MSMFLDTAKVSVKAGRGGDGIKAVGSVSEISFCGAQPPDRAVGH